MNNTKKKKPWRLFFAVFLLQHQYLRGKGYEVKVLDYVPDFNILEEFYDYGNPAGYYRAIKAVLEEELRENGTDEDLKTAYARACRELKCIEEWCKNIIEWGYGTNPGAVCHVTVFLKLQGENLVIYIKDVAPKFNPTEYMESISETARKDVTKNIGIRLIQNSAKDVRYTRLLDTNIIIFVV